MPRRISVPTTVIAVLLLARGVSAQEYTWNPDRPDAFASAGITADRTLSGSEAQIWYRFRSESGQGMQVGPDAVDPSELLTLYSLVPLRSAIRVHEVGFALAPAPGITLLARGSFTQAELDETDAEGGLVRTNTSGIGDTELEALIGVYADGPYRGHVGLGVSIPTGSITEEGSFEGGPVQLPYVLQSGSGTVDLLPSAGILAMNESGSVGMRARARIRITENSRDYHLPHGGELAAWAATRLNDYFSVSAGFVAEYWGQIVGQDPDLDVMVSPVEDPLSSGGTFVDLPVGLNLFVRDGLLAGHRFSVEGRWPIVQNSEGAQIGRDLRVSARWQRSLSLF